MLRRRLSAVMALAAMAAAVICVGSAVAQDKVNLSWKLEKDKPFFQEMRTTANQSMKVMGQDVTQKQTQTFIFSFTPVSVDDNGNWTIKQKIEGVIITIDINNNAVSYDSTNPNAANNALSEFFKQLVGAEFTITMDKNLKVTKVEGRDEFIRKLGTANAQMEPLLKKILNDDALKQMADPTFGMIPNKEVTKGEKWTKTSDLNLGPIGGYTSTQTIVYEGTDEKNPNLHKLKVETKLEYKTPGDADSGALPFKIKSASLKSDGAAGTILFDASKGQIVESDLKLQLSGSLDIEIGGTTTKVDLKQEQSTYVKGHDTNPAVKK
ncbi:MAG: DUF6263 family protein [Gemmataceae bacterium]|nr:DUF6263 family protein [Gemmataceae bacterium]